MESVVEDNSSASTENAAAEKNTEEKTATPPPQEAPKKSKKEDRLRKDDKNVEQFMKSLNSLPSVDEKFAAVCKKYSQTADENKKLQFYIKQSDKRYALLLKEKEQLQHEFNKAILVKSKLENLCRELQKQNKAIKEESLLKIREEEERRKETQAKFQNTLSEITTLLHQNNEKNAKLRDDNINMTEKFKSVVQQYQLREQQVDKMAKQMSLEQQLADAKLQKASLEHQAERERLMAEMEQLKVSVAQYRTKIMELQGTETALRGQLGVYTDKYDEFQNALVKSNQVFGGFKEQMEMMSKKIKKLEKESLSWKKRWETSQTALLDMCGERQTSEERAAAAQRQLQHMQSLCRTLQGERTVLLSTLKENNIERPPLPPPAPAPPPAPVHTPASNAKVDAMAANCVQLRQSLAHLQSQLNTLTNNKKQEEQQQPPKPEKQKKSKSKKNKQAQKVEEKSESKEESDEPSAVKDTTEDEPYIGEATVSNVDNIEEKVDDKTLENLIQAISSANINLCDLEVVTDENGDENENVDKIIEINEVESKQDEIVTNNETVNNEASLQLNDVKTENVVEKIKNEVDGKLNEVNVNVAVNDLNVTQEINSNDEISHIPEVKPISENGA